MSWQRTRWPPDYTLRNLKKSLSNKYTSCLNSSDAGTLFGWRRQSPERRVQHHSQAIKRIRLDKLIRREGGGAGGIACADGNISCASPGVPNEHNSSSCIISTYTASTCCLLNYEKISSRSTRDGFESWGRMKKYKKLCVTYLFYFIQFFSIFLSFYARMKERKNATFSSRKIAIKNAYNWNILELEKHLI